MRLSPSYYPEYVNLYCFFCEADSEDVKVDSIEDDSVVVFCPGCDEAVYVRVID